MIVLTEIGSFIMDVNSYFDSVYAPKELGLENPKKNDYVALRIFQKYGYTEYMKYAYNHEVNLTVLPCEGADGQCNMECEKFGTC